MSVLNDVLKNLETNKAQQQQAIFATHPSQGPVRRLDVLPKTIWLILALMLLAIIALAVQVFLLSTNQFEVPPAVYEAVAESQALEIAQNEAQELAQSESQELAQSETALIPSNKQPIPAQHTTKQHTITQQTTSVESRTGPLNKPVAAQHGQPTVDEPTQIINKSKSTQAEEQAVSALAKGQSEAVKQALVHTDPLMQHNLTLRLMLKAEPEAVVPYLRRNVPDFAQHTELLALAAQAQQRTSQHQQAAVLYKQLLTRQPHDVRWQAGLAISLDGIGDAQSARILYRKILTVPALPSALRQFVKSRYELLERDRG